jgi:hypothetical protein
MPQVPKPLTDQPPIIRYTGVFDYDKLYKSITKWFKLKGYDFQEKKYVHKGKELEFEWYGEKKITEYYKYEVEVALFIWDFGNTEVVKDEQTITMQKGRVQVVIKGSYTLDYAQTWEGSKFTEKLRDIYHKYIIDKDIIFKIYTPLYKQVYSFYDEIRAVLGMEHI